MLNKFSKFSIQRPGRILRTIIFFVLFYLYLWLVIDLRLIYHCGGVLEDFPVFFCDITFFREFLPHPGGLVEYFCAFLSQFLKIGWTGAAIITLQAWLIFICTRILFRAINIHRFCWTGFIPPILILINYTQYAFNMTIAAALLTALIFACIYLKAIRKNMLFRAIFFVFLSIVLYVIAGGAYLVFAALCAVYELLFVRKWQMGILCLLSSIVIPYIGGVLVFGAGIWNAFFALTPFALDIGYYQEHGRISVIFYILYLVVPLVILGSAFGRIFIRMPGALSRNSNVATKKAKKNRRKKFSKPAGRVYSWYADRVIFRWLVETLVLFAVSGAVIFIYYDKELKAGFEVPYHIHNKKWSKVLKSSRYNITSYLGIHAVNQALYHTGKLGYDMFVYPQHPDMLFLPTKGACSKWRIFEAFIELGFLNMAEHNLAETMEMIGERPIILRRMAVINMAKGNIDAAKVYLEALRKTMFDSKWADEYLGKIDSDPTLTDDKKIQQLRSVMMGKDYGFTFVEIEEMLQNLLQKNKQNQMAFEYLMTWYLLTAQIDKLVANLHRLNDFDYPQIPRLYEEAVLLYTFKTQREVDLHERKISAESRQRHKDFMRLYFSYAGNKQAARASLQKDYSDSYFFYIFYGASLVEK